jgi:cell wall-associated NlpC family hydrolase
MKALHDIANGIVGTRYQVGGATLEGADCWGVVMMALGQAGLDLPAWNTGTEDLGPRASVTISRHAKRALIDGTVAPIERPEPGAIVVCRDASDNSPHVAVLVDSEWVLHGTAPSARCERLSAFQERYRDLSFVRWMGRRYG